MIIEWLSFVEALPYVTLLNMISNVSGNGLETSDQDTNTSIKAYK